MNTSQRRQLGLWLGFLLTLALFGANILLEKLVHIPVLPYVLFDWLTTTLPGGIVTFGLDRTIDVVRFLSIGQTSQVAKIAERILAILIFIIIGSVYGLGFGQWVRNRRAALLAALIPIIPSVGLMLWFDNEEGWKWLNVIWAIIGWAVWVEFLRRWLLQTLPALPAEIGDLSNEVLITRRAFLTHMSIRLGTAAVGFVALRYALNAVMPENALAGIQLNVQRIRDLFPPRTDDNFEIADGTRPEITPMPRFYKVDKNILSPNVGAEDWELVIDGMVKTPMRFTYDDILAMDAVEFDATMMCISNVVGGDLISSTWWTGVPLKDILPVSNLQPTAQRFKFYAADGFYETSPVDLLDEMILCYGMGGESLTVGHGFPLRIFIPGRYGMKQPKWLERIEVIDHDDHGYWTDRGWTKEAFIKQTTIIDPIREDVKDGILPIGGIAFSGDKGISKVEVRVDRGDWIEAEIRTPLSPYTWVQWRADLPISKKDGQRISARCVDLDGTPQESTNSDNRPDGATGYHTVEL